MGGSYQVGTNWSYHEENRKYPYHKENREYPYQDNGEMVGKYRDSISKKVKKVKIVNRNKSIIITTKYI